MSAKLIYRLVRNGKIDGERHYEIRRHALIAAAELWQLRGGQVSVYSYFNDCLYHIERTITIAGEFK